MNALEGPLSIRGGHRYQDAHLHDHARSHLGDVHNTVSYSYHHHEASDLVVPPQELGNKHWLVPRTANGRFVGQEHVLKSLEEALIAPPNGNGIGTRQFVLQGIGGVGKSELALQFVKRFRQNFWGIFWIDCSDMTSARISMTKVAARCNWSIRSGELAIEDTVDQLSNCSESWLLILDNCDDPDEDLSVLMPESDLGAVLMTTRIASFCGQYGLSGHWSLKGLAEDTAAKLFTNIAGMSSNSEAQSVHTIVTQLDCHALAITVAGSVVRQGLYSAQEYANLLQNKEVDMLRQKLYQARPTYESIHATFEITAERLRYSESRIAQNALELLGVLGFLDRSGVEEDLFREGWTFATLYAEQSHDSGEITSLSHWHSLRALSPDWASYHDLTPFRSARALLADLSLIFCDQENRTIAIHPLIHAWARQRLSAREQSEKWMIAASTLALAIREERTWQDFTPKLEGHIEVCFNLHGTVAIEDISALEVCRILFAYGWQLYSASNPNVMFIVNRIEKLLKAINSSDRPDENLCWLWTLKGSELFDAGHVDEAFNLLKMVHQRAEALCKPGDQLLFEAQHDLALACNALGDHAQAAELLELVVSNNFGPGIAADDPDCCMSAHVLADVYMDMGNYEKALSIYEDLARREQSWRFDHPRRLILLHELASVCRILKKHSKAAEALDEVIDPILSVTSASNGPTEVRYMDILVDRAGISILMREEQSCNLLAIILQMTATGIKVGKGGCQEQYIAEIYHLLAFTLDEAAQFEEAVEFLQKAEQLEYQLTQEKTLDLHAAIARVKAVLFEVHKQFDLSVETIQRSLQTQENRPVYDRSRVQGKILLARIYAGARDFDNSINLLDRLDAQRADFDDSTLDFLANAKYVIAQELAKVARLKDAIKLTREIVEADQGRPLQRRRTQTVLFKRLLKDEQLEQAEEVYHDLESQRTLLPEDDKKHWTMRLEHMAADLKAAKACRDKDAIIDSDRSPTNGVGLSVQ